MRKILVTTALATILATILVAPASVPAFAAESVEVLNWWTSGGEAAALNVLKQKLESQGVTWQDMPVAGGGGGDAMTVLRARVTSGNPPTAAQLLGFDITDWATQGSLGNLDDLAAKEGWDKVVPDAVQKFSKFDGHWVAAPINLHSTNWLWINKAALDAAGGKAPTTWDELIAVLDKMKANGITPVAIGGQAWQEQELFDAIVLSEGADFYKSAFLDLDPAALGSEKMTDAFQKLATLKTYVDPNFSGRDWNLASAMVINGNAGIQFMGDWAKGEFINAGKVADTDYVCTRFPGTQGSVVFNSDQFAMFNVGADKREAQLQLASDVMDPAVQSAFNVLKGAVPPRTDVSDTDFDSCGKKGILDLKEAVANGTLFGSMTHGHAAPAAIKNAIYDVVDRAFNGELTPADATSELVTAVAAAQ